MLKKIDLHAKSAAHKASVKQEQKAKEISLEKSLLKATSVWVEANREKLTSTARMFNIAYTCTKEELSLRLHPKITELMEKNGQPKTSMLYSNVSCASIIHHIATEMRNDLIEHVKKSSEPFAVLVDESTTLSTKSALIIYLRLSSTNDDVCNYFFDLVELSEGTSGEAIASAVVKSLQPIGEDIVKSGLIAFASDGASAMRGEYSGAGVSLQKLLKIESPLIAVHCRAHRLELAVHGAVKSSGEISRLQLLTDSLYSFYHRSPKSMYELQQVAATLHSQLLKVSQIFTVRWVFSSWRAITAFITDYAALFNYLQRCASDKRRSTTDKARCRGFANKLKTWSLVAELLLLSDTLEVLWHLSAYLQSRSASVIDANLKVTTALKTLTAMKEHSGPQLRQFLNEKMDTYKGVLLTRTENDVEASTKSLLSLK